MASPNVLLVLLLAGGLAAAHAFAGTLRSLHVIPRSRFLSIAGGVSVAYVFVHLFPEITERQAAIADEAGSATALLATANEKALFLVALVGFTAFYGLERSATQSGRDVDHQEGAEGTDSQTSERVFWLHTGSFAVYNALIGYFLLHREETGVANLLLYSVAMGLHFVVNDHGLREHHQEAYMHLGRWILVGGILGGVVVGFLVTVPESSLSLLLAFLAGGVILNVVKEELPEERESSFWAFCVGLVSYTFILLLL